MPNLFLEKKDENPKRESRNNKSERTINVVPIRNKEATNDPNLINQAVIYSTNPVIEL